MPFSEVRLVRKIYRHEFVRFICAYAYHTYELSIVHYHRERATAIEREKSHTVRYPWRLAASAIVKVSGDKGRLSEQAKAGSWPQPSAEKIHSLSGVLPVRHDALVGEQTAEAA